MIKKFTRNRIALGYPKNSKIITFLEILECSFFMLDNKLVINSLFIPSNRLSTLILLKFIKT